MQAALRQAIETLLDGMTINELAVAAKRLSARYRAEVKDGRMHLDGMAAAHAYIAARMPATLAAMEAVFAQMSESGLAPQILLDCGAGPGTVLFAAMEHFSTLKKADLIEQSPHIRAVGQKLTTILDGIDIHWHNSNVEQDTLPATKADLVTLSYVLDELHDDAQDKLVDVLWQKTAMALVLVEPGTPAGWRRLMRQRARLLQQGAHMLAPCPHADACPLVAPDWCHFAARLARSRIHRLTKEADVAWEDEKFSFIAVSRVKTEMPQVRVIAPPQKGSGKVSLKLCCNDGSMAKKMFTRSEGEFFKAARRCEWGDALFLPHMLDLLKARHK